MNARIHRLAAFVRPVAQEHGGDLVAIEYTRSGHLRVILARPDGSQFSYYTGGTPSDVRASNNAKAQIKRALRLGRVR